MTESVYRGRHVARRRDVLVLRTAVRKLPLLDLVDGHTAHTHGAVLAQNGPRALEVLRIGGHRDVDRAERPGTPVPPDGGGFFDLDVARERCSVRLDALHRSNQPVDQVDVVT